MAALMCIQRCIRQRAELNYRAMLKEKYRRSWNAAENAKEYLLELEIARLARAAARAGPGHQV